MIQIGTGFVLYIHYYTILDATVLYKLYYTLLYSTVLYCTLYSVFYKLNIILYTIL